MKKVFIIFASFVCQTSFADTKIDEININSNMIEIKKESNQIFFKNNEELKPLPKIIIFLLFCLHSINFFLKNLMSILI